jgi:very-short-patch-repair endonuclease
VTAKRLTPVARALRRNRTDVEDRLWQRLRNRQLEGEKFVFQFPIGPYVADFACRTARLVVELDGGQHGEMIAADAARTAVIEAFGYRVIRFWTSDVTGNLDGVLEAIRQELLIARNRPE